ncbi:MAG: GYD domain-containing protein [Dehalococcoidia bacterium]
MATFMLKAHYLTLSGVLAEGYARRTEYFRQLIALYKGDLVAVYWPEDTSEADVIAIVEIPDPTAMKAIELAVNESGVVQLRVLRLLDVETMDQARKMLPPYRAPGEDADLPPSIVR